MAAVFAARPLPRVVLGAGGSTSTDFGSSGNGSSCGAGSSSTTLAAFAALPGLFDVLALSRRVSVGLGSAERVLRVLAVVVSVVHSCAGGGASGSTALAALVLRPLAGAFASGFSTTGSSSTGGGAATSSTLDALLVVLRLFFGSSYNDQLGSAKHRRLNWDIPSSGQACAQFVLGWLACLLLC